MMPYRPIAVFLFSLVLIGCESSTPSVEQWTTHEIVLQATGQYNNPYTDISVEAVFKSNTGDVFHRPAFWDGGQVWKVRFTPPEAGTMWTWTTTPSLEDGGLAQSGSFRSVGYSGENALLQEGLLQMSQAKRNIVHRSGKSFLVVGDTPWALPFRATTDQVKLFASDRREKGFNTALLMTVQPDMHAEGPDARNTDQGFARGFADLADGHINELNPEYFQYLDSLVTILVDHEIVPVYQPVFHGFGWKGLDVLGNHVNPQEYVRYTKYLLARYGSMPAIWLIAGDNGGDDPGVKEAGEMLETADAYGQPTGLHYNPCDDYIAPWAENNPIKHCMHYNKSHQAEDWLDFQWAQTGHSNEHLYHKVERLYDDPIVKGVANGEPTYEGMNNGANGLGWWQGEEAWMQFMSGGTMGVVYGAAGLWQWKITADEAGWTEWATQPKAWHEAMAMDGSTYVGLFGQILDGLDMTDIEKRWDLADGKPLLAKPGELYISYLNEGGTIDIADIPDGMNYRWVDPKTGGTEVSGSSVGGTFTAPGNEPAVLILSN